MTILWTPNRHQLRDLLLARHPDLADFYVQAIDALGTDTVARTRLIVASHCLRELFRSLPQVLGDPVTKRSDVNRPAKELFRTWPDGSLDASAAPSEDRDDTPRAVSATVFRAARAVALAAADGNRNSRDLTAIVATGQIAPDQTAPLNRLHEAIEFFREWTHAVDYSKPDRALPSDTQVHTELRIIEEAMLTRLGNMADRARAMRELLASANRRVEKGPT